VDRDSTGDERAGLGSAGTQRLGRQMQGCQRLQGNAVAGPEWETRRSAVAEKAPCICAAVGYAVSLQFIFVTDGPV